MGNVSRKMFLYYFERSSFYFLNTKKKKNKKKTKKNKKKQKKHKKKMKENDLIVDSFDDMQLNEQLLRGIYSHGFEKPSKLQKMAIIPLTRGENLKIKSQSGTGKTGKNFLKFISLY